MLAFTQRHFNFQSVIKLNPSVMKKIQILALSVMFASCSQKASDDVESQKTAIINADKAFSAMSAEKGMREAFLAFAAEEVIKPQDGRQPVVGRESLVRSFEGVPPRDFVLTWEPLKADAAGGLGYTFGNWTRKSKTNAGSDTTVYGNYISIWKRQDDGSWKYVFDSGNSTPGPTVLEK
jgi:ketosteroid isomerase-like protein